MRTGRFFPASLPFHQKQCLRKFNATKVTCDSCHREVRPREIGRAVPVYRCCSGSRQCVGNRQAWAVSVWTWNRCCKRIWRRTCASASTHVAPDRPAAVVGPCQRRASPHVRPSKPTTGEVTSAATPPHTQHTHTHVGCSLCRAPGVFTGGRCDGGGGDSGRRNIAQSGWPRAVQHLRSLVRTCQRLCASLTVAADTETVP